MFVRELQESDWKDYKSLRLEAVRLYASNFGTSYMEEASKSDEDWRAMMLDVNSRYFGLYDDNGHMAGISAVFTYRLDQSGRTALLAAGYIRKLHRGRGYSHLLYQARIQWAIDSGRFNRILVGHRDGNEASRRANQAFGFEYIGSEQKKFGDGKSYVKHQYEVRLR